MKPLYILFIVASGVFLFILFAYFAFSIRSWRYKVKLRRDILKAYNDKDLAKIEYDCAFYDGDLYSREHSSERAKQVTIDEVLSGEAESEEDWDELSRFKPIEEVQEKSVEGPYDPEAVKDN